MVRSSIPGTVALVELEFLLHSLLPLIILLACRMKFRFHSMVYISSLQFDPLLIFPVLLFPCVPIFIWIPQIYVDPLLCPRHSAILVYSFSCLKMSYLLTFSQNFSCAQYSLLPTHSIHLNANLLRPLASSSHLLSRRFFISHVQHLHK